MTMSASGVANFVRAMVISDLGCASSNGTAARATQGSTAGREALRSGDSVTRLVLRSGQPTAGPTDEPRLRAPAGPPGRIRWLSAPGGRVAGDKQPVEILGVTSAAVQGAFGRGEHQI